MRAAGVGKDFKENPNLRDNWTDAEGYYSKCCPAISPLSSGVYLEARLKLLLSLSVGRLCFFKDRRRSSLRISSDRRLPVGNKFAKCAFIRSEHRGDAGQALRRLRLHRPGCVQQCDPSQGHCQGRPGGGSQDHPKQRAHVSRNSFLCFSIKCLHKLIHFFTHRMQTHYNGCLF